jgi:DNA polymerase elongation subunit (family B)
MIPTTYERVSTMGTATLWKMLMLAWSYKHNLAIPAKESKTDFVGGLSRLLKVGYSKNVLKLDFSSLYPSIQLVHDVFPDCDVTGAMKGMLSYFRNTRIKYKELAEEFYNIDRKKSESYGNKQLPIKIFINSLFGALSAPQVFAWGDMNKGQQITCTGRQYLRQMIKFFMSRGYTPLVMDTDGVNFSLPDDVEERKYVGRGLNWKVKEGKEFNQGSLLLAATMPTTYERVSTMGTATLWKMLMLAWSHKHGLAIPAKESKTDFVGGLSRLLKVGYSKNVLKLDFSSLYPSIQLVHDVFPDCDITGAMKAMLVYFRDTRIKYKQLAEKYKKIDKSKSESYSNKQLPIKVFINSLFGSLSAPQVFHWGDMYMGEQITTTGRQYLRQMIRFFMKKGYSPTVLDTDGVNFTLPIEGVENRKYIGKGNNWLVEKGKEYFGYNADVAEYNDMFMKGAMGLDCDGTWDSCINLARKNYATLESNGKIKLTGNSIKSKKLPLYIEEFLDKGIHMLLNGHGKDFIEYYYEYLQIIFDQKIPLSKIAQRAKVKLTIDDYIKRLKQKTKAGNSMSRMAYIELAIQNNLNINLGDVIMYVNNGKKASQGDVQKLTAKQIKEINQEKKLKNPKAIEITEGVQINCYMLDPNTIETNPNLIGEYNVPRAITTFNKRIEPLLVCFKQEVRDQLIVDDPSQRSIFTTSQCELISGLPFEEGDQDTIEDLLKLSESEIEYWTKRGLSPDYIYEKAEPGWENYIL